MDKEILRKLTLEAFRRTPETQFESLKRSVAGSAEERGLLGTRGAAGSRISYPSEPQLSMQTQSDLLEVLWDLIVERAVTPGRDAFNAEWPWLRMTERGKRLGDRELGSSS